jgi:hypothetical protein
VGASGVFCQLQDALNAVWGVKAKPGRRDLRIFAQPLPFLREGRRGLFPTVGLPNNRERAQGVQSLYSIVIPGGVARKVAKRPSRSAIPLAEITVMQPI